MIRAMLAATLRVPRLTIGRRFGVVALLVIPLVASVCAIGAIGVSRMNEQVTELYDHGYRHTLASARLSRALSAVEVVAVQAVLRPTTGRSSNGVARPARPASSAGTRHRSGRVRVALPTDRGGP